MYKVTYKQNGETKEKYFKTKSEAIGFQIVAHTEYHCYYFTITRED